MLDRFCTKTASPDLEASESSTPAIHAEIYHEGPSFHYHVEQAPPEFSPEIRTRPVLLLSQPLR